MEAWAKGQPKQALMMQGGGAIVVALIFIVHLLDAVAGWVMAMLMQILLLLLSVFILVSYQEYQDRMVREPIDVERNVNPARMVERMFRIAHLVEFAYLGCWWMLPFIAPLVVFDHFIAKTPRMVEATRLWKDIEPMKTEEKFKLAYNVAMFFFVMFALIYSLITHYS